MSKKAIIEGALLAIYEEEGVLHPRTIVDRARDRTHPLHPFFDWDNRKAADEYRLIQASRLIRTVHVRITTADEDYRVRAFHPMSYVGRSESGYIHEADVISTERPLLLQVMHREWTAMRRRYGHMNEFWKMVEADQQEKVG